MPFVVQLLVLLRWFAQRQTLTSRSSLQALWSSTASRVLLLTSLFSLRLSSTLLAALHLLQRTRRSLQTLLRLLVQLALLILMSSFSVLVHLMRHVRTSLSSLRTLLLLMHAQLTLATLHLVQKLIQSFLLSQRSRCSLLVKRARSRWLPPLLVQTMLLLFLHCHNCASQLIFSSTKCLSWTKTIPFAEIVCVF